MDVSLSHPIFLALISLFILSLKSQVLHPICCFSPQETPLPLPPGEVLPSQPHLVSEKPQSLKLQPLVNSGSSCSVKRNMDLVLSAKTRVSGPSPVQSPSSWFLSRFTQEQECLANRNTFIFSKARKHQFLTSWAGNLTFPWHSKLPHYDILPGPPSLHTQEHWHPDHPMPSIIMGRDGHRSHLDERHGLGSTNLVRRSLEGCLSGSVG